MATFFNTLAGGVLIIVGIVQVLYTSYNLFIYSSSSTTAHYFQLGYLLGGVLLVYGGYRIANILYIAGVNAGGRR
jgi:hypothetical protein